MSPTDIILSQHALMQMRRRRVTFQDAVLVLEMGEHVEGKEEGTLEACTEVDGRPLTVVYDRDGYEQDGVFRIVTVIRRRCGE